MLTAQSQEARNWLSDNIDSEGYQPDMPRCIYVERRYIDAILDGIDQAGLTVDAIEREANDNVPTTTPRASLPGSEREEP